MHVLQSGCCWVKQNLFYIYLKTSFALYCYTSRPKGALSYQKVLSSITWWQSYMIKYHSTHNIAELWSMGRKFMILEVCFVLWTMSTNSLMWCACHPDGTLNGAFRCTVYIDKASSIIIIVLFGNVHIRDMLIFCIFHVGSWSSLIFKIMSSQPILTSSEPFIQSRFSSLIVIFW